MNQAEAVEQWWSGLTAAEQYAVLRLPTDAALSPTLALDLAESGVIITRVNVRAGTSPALIAFPHVLREFLARVRTEWQHQNA
jgi:hypothetical protein